MTALTLVSAHAACSGVAFEAADERGRVHRFVVSALALDELERGQDAPSDWMRAFRAHEPRILEAAEQAAERAAADDPDDGPIVLGMASFAQGPAARVPSIGLPFGGAPMA